MLRIFSRLSHAEWRIFLLLLLCYVYFLPRYADWSQTSRVALIMAIVVQGRLEIDDYIGSTGDYAELNGHKYSDKAPGPALLAVPVYALVHWATTRPPGEGIIERLSQGAALRETLKPGEAPRDKVEMAIAQATTTWAIIAVPAAALGVALYRLLGRITTSAPTRWIITLAYGLGTSAFAYAGAMYSHQLAAALLFISFAALWGQRNPGVWRLLMVGLFIGVALISEYPTALIAGGLGLYALAQTRRLSTLFIIGAGAVAPIALMGVHNQLIFGTPLPVGYSYSALWQNEHQTGFYSLSIPTWSALWGITLSPYRGLFFVSPFLALGVIGLVTMARRASLRAEAILCGWCVLSFLAFNTTSAMWTGGFGVGPRYLVPMLPFLAFAAGDAVEHLRGSRAARVIIGALIGASFLVTWSLTIGGQAFPGFEPYPLWMYSWPALASGNIARNLGTLAGLPGWWSLLPLALVAPLLALPRGRLLRSAHTRWHETATFERRPSGQRWRRCEVQVAAPPRWDVVNRNAAIPRKQSWIWTASTCALLAVLLCLAGYNLERYPTTWFDEGSHLHVPKALVQHGVYADVSSDGFRYFGPTTGVGPTVLLPIAAVFKVAGIGLIQARLVIVAYLLVAVVAFLLVARHLHGNVTASLAVALLVTAPGINLLYLGRQVLGEVPALAFLMLGILAWSRQVDGVSGRNSQLVWASVWFGLAALTKNQLTLILAPTFVLLFLADRFYYRRLSVIQTALPFVFVGGGAFAGQFAPLLPLVGTDEFGATLALARQASTGAIFVFLPDRILSSLKFLLGADAFAYWAVPGLLYGLVYARRDARHGVQHALLLIFAACGLGWFAFGSIGWQRYAFPGLAVAAIFAARLMVDLLQASSGAANDPRARLRTVALVAVIVLPIGAGLLQNARAIASARDDAPQQMANYLAASVQPDAVIETWEPEMGFLTDHQYHYPSSGWLDRAVRAKWLGGVAALQYDPLRDATPSYLLVGRFGKYTGMYDSYVQQARPELLRSIGDYDLYRMTPYR